MSNNNRIIYKQGSKPFWIDMSKEIREGEDVVVGDEVYFEDYERDSKGRIKVTARNGGTVTDVFLKDKVEKFFEIELKNSTGRSPRDLKTYKILPRVFLNKNPHRKPWKNEAERSKEKERQEKRLMTQFGISISETGEVTYL